MNLKIIHTKDGSSTLYSPTFNEHYHSVFGAINESKHVFIEAGFNFLNLKSIKIFELGFGTALNALLTYLESAKNKVNVDYSAIEFYPVTQYIIQQLNYTRFLSEESKKIFDKLHEVSWNKKIKISNHFHLTKIKHDFNDYLFTKKYNLIFFDAFAPEKQPELWSYQNFAKIYEAMDKQGVLTTYSSKGVVKQNLRNAGFQLERLPGPEGKRHILRAIKK
ncbi:MAG TPA: tRNA (5-methylaminomethyl-2-thiouridine)(34)-methyltransferase MnmD [Bacteroidales bacterium]|nr:tRNA (5-methylaminomethyl-2-thiouridine)(34)-methyltransferase MnmD [Bacteroidales bacterium]